MADGVIYTHTGTEQALLIPPRHSFMREFDAGIWTSLVMGIYWSFNGNANVAAASSDETIGASTPATRVYFGLKNASTTDLPHIAGSDFIGVYSDPANGSNTMAVNPAVRITTNMRVGASQGVTQLGSTGFVNNISQIFTNTIVRPETGSTDFCRFLGIKFSAQNIGTGTQQVKIEPLDTGAYAAVSVADSVSLRAKMLGAAIIDAEWITMLGTLPNAVFIYLPFFNNKLRLHALAVEKLA